MRRSSRDWQTLSRSRTSACAAGGPAKKASKKDKQKDKQKASKKKVKLEEMLEERKKDKQKTRHVNKLLEELRSAFVSEILKSRHLKEELILLKLKLKVKSCAEKGKCKKRKRPSEFNAKQKRVIASNQKWTCNVCKQMLKDDYEIDHKVPLHGGGSSDTLNGQALCPACHTEKTRDENKKLSRSRT